MRKNRSESAFEMEMMKQGWGVSKRGWPDFLCYQGDRVICVEVKPRSTRNPSKPQRSVMEMLTRHGVECFMWSPDSGLVEFQSGDYMRE